MAKKTVIEGSNNVRASQLKEFFRQIDEQIITGSILQSLLENKNPFGIDAPKMGSLDVEKFIHLITGGENNLLTKEQLFEWRGLIMYSIRSMRNIYERYDLTDSSREYYKSCWEKIDNSKNDEEFIDGLNWLITSIKWF